MDIIIKKNKFLKALLNFIHVLKYYRKLNNEQHTKPIKMYVS